MTQKGKTLVQELDSELKFKHRPAMGLQQMDNEIANKFVIDYYESKTRNYKEEDWNQVLSQISHPIVAHIIGTSKNIPREVFDKAQPRINNYEGVFNRLDLTNSDIRKFLTIIGEKRAKELMLESPEVFSDASINEIIKLSENSLKMLDYLPFAIASGNSPRWKEIKENFVGKYGDNEQALIALASNKTLLSKARNIAFNMASVPTVINKPTVEIARKTYEMTADAAFGENGVEHKTMYEAIDILKKMAEQGSLPEECQIDVVNRYFHHPFDDQEDIIKGLATTTKSDNVGEMIAELASFNIVKKLFDNPNIGSKTVMKLYNKYPTWEVKKDALVAAICSNNSLSNEILDIIIATGDKNLIRASILKSYNSQRAYQKLMANVYNDHKGYFDFVGEFLHGAEEIRSGHLFTEKEKKAIISKLFYSDLSVKKGHNTKDNNGANCVRYTKLISSALPHSYISGLDPRQMNMIEDVCDKIEEKYAKMSLALEGSSCVTAVQNMKQIIRGEYDSERLKRKYYWLCSNNSMHVVFDPKRIIQTMFIENDKEEKNKTVNRILKEERLEELGQLQCEIIGGILSSAGDDPCLVRYYALKLSDMYDNVENRIRELIDKERGDTDVEL